jgi:hypothetical protein
MSDNVVSSALLDAIRSMQATKPRALTSTVNFLIDDDAHLADEQSLVDLLVGEDLNDEIRMAMHMTLAQWDAVRVTPWSAGTESRSRPRRDVVYGLLKISDEARALLTEAFPMAIGRDVILAAPAPWDPWFTMERQNLRSFYWDAYKRVLSSKNPAWDPDAVANLDVATSNIVGRLADPTRTEPYQTKGLVVGYVQSGKTANFTGTIAKAIDAGYRLIIVLTGTIELLRGQTQRRLDMELVGEENILGGKDRNDHDAIADVDYFGTEDADLLAGKFLQHNVDINRLPDVPGIKRLTTMEKGYRRLKIGLDSLDFARTGELRNPAKPVFDPENLFGVDARVAVMLKNPAALKAIIRDLQDIKANMGEVPVLIIDDEADQASINTKKPKPGEIRERTAINALIGDLLKKLPRAQYLAYTATPYANVFASPAEATDVYPKDFIINLEPAPSYMGAKSFHDLDDLPEGVVHSAANSNEKAFVRSLNATTDAQEVVEIRKALDAFVLAGAIKKWREAQGLAGDYKHHTMLVHSSSRQADHLLLANMVKTAWTEAMYASPVGFESLRELYYDDFAVVAAARPWGASNQLPRDFGELRDYVGLAVDAIESSGGDPVVIVNGSSDSDYRAMDFQLGPYWRVMVGGTKLSRGFTVEGLTVSYFRRRATAASTLMQMGRWFGYRDGYQDLVRLFIGRAVTAGQSSYDMYAAFTSIVKDEEDFRDQIRLYSEMEEDGRPLVTPKDLPPFVFWSLNWLPPVARNQRYNAKLVSAGAAGKITDLRRFAQKPGASHAHRLAAVTPWLASGNEVTLSRDNGKPFDATVALVSAESVLDQFDRFKWEGDVGPSLGYLRRAILKLKLVEDFAVIFPKVGRPAEVNGIDLYLVDRAYRDERKQFITRDSHLDAALMSVTREPDEDGNSPVAHRFGESALWDSRGRRGALLVEFAQLSDPQAVVAPGAVAPLFTFVLPSSTAKAGRPALQVFDKGHPQEVVVPVE